MVPSCGIPGLRSGGTPRAALRGQRRRFGLLAAGVLCLAAGQGGCDTGPPAPSDDTRPVRDAASAGVSAAPAPREDEQEGTRIVAFGNSLTAGLGVPLDLAYPAHLQRRLRAEGYRCEVINAGVSGETTAGGLRRLPWILQRRPSIVVLELGANDGLRGQPLPGIAANLKTLIQGLRNGGAAVVLAGMQIPPNYGEDYTKGFAALFTRVAREQSVPLIPFFLEGVAARKSLNQADGIHPTGDGYRIVAGTVFAALEPLLNKERSAVTTGSAP